MMNKENDLFLNMLYNPDMSLLDLKQVGLDSSNTGIDSMDSYRENKKVKELFTTPQGTFKEEDFTKLIMIKFDEKNEFKICSYRAEEIKNKDNKKSLNIEKI